MYGRYGELGAGSVFCIDASYNTRIYGFKKIGQLLRMSTVESRNEAKKYIKIYYGEVRQGGL